MNDLPTPSSSGKNSATFGLSPKVIIIMGTLFFPIFFILQFTGYLQVLTGQNDQPVNQFGIPSEILLGIMLAGLLGLIIISNFFIMWTMKLLAGRRQKFREKRSLTNVIFKVRVPKENEVLADSAEAMYNGLYSIYEGVGRFKMEEQISFEIVKYKGLISFYVVSSEEISGLVERQIYSQYPDAIITQTSDYNIFPENAKTHFVELTQANESPHPLRTYRDAVKEAGTSQLKEMTIDSLNPLTNALNKVEDEEGAAIQILIRPASDGWQNEGKKLIEEMYKKTKSEEGKPGEQLTSGEQEAIKNIESNISKPGFECVIRIVSASPIDQKAKLNLSNIYAAFGQFNNVQHNSLKKKTQLNQTAFFQCFIKRQFPLINYAHPNPFLLLFNWYLKRQCGHLMVLNTEEIASIFHLPNKNISTPQIDWLQAKKAPAPLEVPGLQQKYPGLLTEVRPEAIFTDQCLLGYNEYRGIRKEVCIQRDDRRRHIYSIGRTGMGKSVFMENQVYQDIVNGEGVCVIDPHGDLAMKCLEFVPKERMDDVYYFDPSDIERPMALNMLEYDNEDQKDFVVGEMIAILYKLFEEFIGPRFEHIVRNSLLAIMDHPDGGTLVEMMRILTDDEYKDECLIHVKNPLVRAFWKEEMAQQVQFHKSEMLGPVLSKFGRFVSNDMMRNIIGQPKSSFNIRKIMDEQKILLVNLSKGKIGDINCNLLGMIFVGKILMAALSRTNIPADERKDFYMYVDEFQNFATDSFATILSEARKYKLALNITHQYVGQLKEEIQKAVFGNVGTFISFRIGSADSEVIAKETKPIFDEPDLLNLEKYNAYCKLLVNGASTKPFSMGMYPPVDIKWTDYSEEIKQICRLKFGNPKEIVEADIERRGRFDLIPD